MAHDNITKPVQPDTQCPRNDSTHCHRTADAHIADTNSNACNPAAMSSRDRRRCGGDGAAASGAAPSALSGTADGAFFLAAALFAAALAAALDLGAMI